MYQVLTGNNLETLATLPAESVQCVVTSPPYYGLRSYLADNDPMKPFEIGQEKTPQEFIEKLVAVFREVRRVLKSDGTVWLNIDDSYAGSNQGAGTKNPTPKQASNRGTQYMMADGHKSKLAKVKGIQNKSLMLIPFRLAIALQDDGWLVRCDVIWNKPNAMPESVTDRPTRAHEYLFLLTKSQSYYYNNEAILEPYTKPLDRWGGDNLKAEGQSSWDEGTGQSSYRDRNMRPNPNGRNRRSVWNINTEPYEGAHFATYPKRLVELCVFAGSREGDTVLDPFSGSGTTGEVSQTHKRDYVGCELRSDYVALSHRRIGSAQPSLFPLCLTQREPDLKLRAEKI
jgi:DNA modification methylase